MTVIVRKKTYGAGYVRTRDALFHKIFVTFVTAIMPLNLINVCHIYLHHIVMMTATEAPNNT